MSRNRAVLSVLLIALACAGPATAQTTRPADKAWTPKILAADSDLYLPDYSYAGYRWSEQPIPVPQGKVFDVSDFGARPDDGKDDTAAIAKAVSAAHAHDGAAVVRFGPGRFILRQILWITRGDFVLAGAGSGEKGTVLAMPDPLGKMELPADFKRRKAYLIRNNKRVRGKLFSLFSWAGGVIWSRNPAPGYTRLAGLTGGRRGSHQVTLDRAPGKPLPAGTTLQVRWYNREGKASTLLSHVMDGADVSCGKRLYENPKRPLIRQDVTVVSLDGKTLTVREPLMHDIRPGWACDLYRRSYLQEVGVQGFAVEFPDVPYAGHHLEAGYNAIYLTGVAHGWVKDVRVHNGDAAILTSGCRNLTLRGIRATGRVGHYTVHTGGSCYVLLRDFDFTAPALHNPSFNTFAVRSVFTHGRIREARLDQHCGLNHQNLFDDLDIRMDDPGRLFHHGGAGYWRPTAGAFNTFWNVRVRSAKSGHPRITDAPSARLIGLVGTPALKLTYGPNAHIEGLNRPGLAVPSLFEYQLERRLKRQGEPKEQVPRGR